MSQSYILLSDVRSYGKGSKLYGKAGDTVHLISEHGHIAIVMGKEQFSTPFENMKLIDHTPTKQ